MNIDSYELLSGERVVPVVVLDNPTHGIQLAHLFQKYGLNSIEITLRTEAALPAIEAIHKAVPELLIGAGSIRTADQVHAARAAGAQFLVSPGFSQPVYQAAVDTGTPWVPGTATASEVMQCMDLGIQLVKFFPAQMNGGAAMIKAIGEPLPEARFFPTGGVNLDLLDDYLSLANVTCVGGSWLARKEWLDAGQFDKVEEQLKRLPTSD